MRSKFSHLKPRVLALREEGLSYSQICERLGVKVPQSTLSNWCSAVALSVEARQRLHERMSWSPERKALVSKWAREKREKQRARIHDANSYLSKMLYDADIAKISLAMLYLGEGSKREQHTVSFSNSNAGIVRLYLKLFEKVYMPDVKRFRITIQCRTDQDIDELEKYWREVIAMPGIRFYKTRVDQRTVGKPSIRPAYKGVCRIDYIDARIQFELVNLGRFLAPHQSESGR